MSRHKLYDNIVVITYLKYMVMNINKNIIFSKIICVILVKSLLQNLIIGFILIKDLRTSLQSETSAP